MLQIRLDYTHNGETTRLVYNLLSKEDQAKIRRILIWAANNRVRIMVTPIESKEVIAA